LAVRVMLSDMRLTINERGKIMKKLFISMLAIALVCMFTIPTTTFALEPGITIVLPECNPCSGAGEGVIYGIVTDEAGTPIEGVRVETGYGKYMDTNFEGLYLYHHQGGYFGISATKTGWVTEEATGTPGPVEVIDAGFTYVSIVLEPSSVNTGTVYGAILDSSNAPVRGNVWLEKGGHRYSAGSSDIYGKFTSPGLDPGTYVIMFGVGAMVGPPTATGGNVTVYASQQSVKNMEVGSGGIQGTVKDCNEPPFGIGASIQVYTGGEWVWIGSASFGSGAYGPFELVDGTYSFRSILGPYNDVQTGVVVNGPNMTLVNFTQGPSCQ